MYFSITQDYYVTFLNIVYVNNTVVQIGVNVA